ncbi:hypothetical protein ACP70R_049028 [Stipagrostis hirtigluma subsp. patula]
MAENGVKQSMLHAAGDRDPANAEQRKPRPGGARRFRRCRTALSSDTAQESFPRSRNTRPPDASAASPLVAPKEQLRGAHPRFWLVGLLLLAYLLSGTTAFYLVMDHMSGDRSSSRVLDALYFCVVTMTTVGYGDIVPSSDGAKLLACAFAFAGVGLVGAVLSKAAEYRNTTLKIRIPNGKRYKSWP